MSDDIHLRNFFTAIPIAKILYEVMAGTYKNPDYEKYLKDNREIRANEFFRKEYTGGET